MKQLAQIQAAIHVPKGNINSFSKYKYRTCGDILEAVKPLLDGCTITLSDELVLAGDRFYVKATATILSPSGESMAVTAFARESLDKKGMDDSQITGAASTYARKYALNGLLAIDDTEDADSMNNTAVKEKTPDQIRDALHEKYADQIVAIKGGITSGDYSVAASIWFRLDGDDKSALWVAPTKGGVFTAQECEVIKSEQFRKSHFGETA